MTPTLYSYLASVSYPGRGIFVGKAPKSGLTLVAYFIMGRSQNSQKRFFSPTEDGVRVLSLQPKKTKNAHLLLYTPVRTVGGTTLVSNGDQTDTVCAFMERDAHPGFDFEAALSTRTYEDDAPHFTPRISAAASHRLGGVKFSLIKKEAGEAVRYIFDYPVPTAGFGRFLSTYKENGEPLPAFQGEPVSLALTANSAATFAAGLWKALHPDYKVSLFVRSIDPVSGKVRDVVKNRFEPDKSKQQNEHMPLRHGVQPLYKTFIQETFS